MIFCYFLNIKSLSLMHRTADGIGDEKITFGSSDFVLRQFPYTCYLWH